MRIKPYYPVTRDIDGEDVALRIKRMTLEEWAAFDAVFQRVGTPTVLRFVARLPDGPEQEKDAAGAYVISFDTIVERRMAEFSSERRAEFEAAKAADEHVAQAFIVDTFERFVTVERGVIEERADGTEHSVTSGGDFLRVFGARQDVLLDVIALVRTENTLDARQKKASMSPHGSSPGSTAPAPARAGRRRATTAAPVGTAGSAATAGAGTTTTDPPSGSTAPSSPRGAPSVN